MRRVLFRFVNDYRGWCARRGLIPSHSLARAWREVRVWLGMIGRVYAEETRTGARVQTNVPFTAPHATKLELRRDELHRLQEAGLRLGVRQPIPRDKRGKRIKRAAQANVRARFVWRLTEEALWANLEPCGLTEVERQALQPVIRGLVLVQKDPVAPCRTCRVRWVIRRGRMLDCARCRNVLPPWTRSRRAHVKAGRFYADIEALRKQALEVVLSRIPRDAAGRPKKPVPLQEVERTYQAMSEQLYQRATQEALKDLSRMRSSQPRRLLPATYWARKRLERERSRKRLPRR